MYKFKRVVKFLMRSTNVKMIRCSVAFLDGSQETDSGINLEELCIRTYSQLSEQQRSKLLIFLFF